MACVLFIVMSAYAKENVPESASQAAGVNVLVLKGWRIEVDPTLLKRFEAENIHFVTQNISEPLSAEMLREFHVVLIVDWEVGLRTEWFSPNSLLSRHLTTKKNVELIHAYVQEGGGLFYTPPFGSPMSIDGGMRFFERYGAVLESRQARDEKHAFSNPNPKNGNDYYEYAWTTEIAKHPAVSTVKRIFYPTSELRWDDMYATPTLRLKDAAWIPLVKGMPGSVGAKGIDYHEWITQESKAPVLAAVRKVGAGRVGVLMVNAYYTFWKPFENPKDGWIGESHTGKVDGIFLEKGDGTLPSDGYKLMAGMIGWLAEGANAKGFGGFDNATSTSRPKIEPEQSPKWLTSWKPNDGSQWFKVLVGARSSYSDGEGSIAEYANEAKKAGVSVLYMTETFERFDPKKWKDFVGDCEKASDSSIKVFPGLDIADTCGNRYLSLTSPLFPPKNLLTADAKAIAKACYLCLCFPRGITVIYRATGSSVPQELLKHFHGVGIYTYRNSVLEDNSFPAYQWELFRFSNPIPFVVHQTYSPKDIPKEAAAGHQMYVSADSLTDLSWYLGEHGTSHLWENPLHFQVSSGPKITGFGRESLVADVKTIGDSVSFSLESDEPIVEVRLIENYNLYRRWTPNAKNFTANNIKLSEDHVSWSMIVAKDAKGRTVVSPGILSGKQAAHTWRCGDRQNWWSFPNIYAGTDAAQFDIRVPVFGTNEGMGLFPEMHPFLRGDNMAALLDFSYASPAVYIQDVFLDQRYNQALFEDAAYDAKSSNSTARSRVYDAKIRYYRFWSKELGNAKDEFYPSVNNIEISLRQPAEATGNIFPIFTRLNVKHGQVMGDKSYSYVDVAGKKVSGKLTQGWIDLPKGGAVGGFIALSDGIRVSSNGDVGFPSPEAAEGALPVGTHWRAQFVDVPSAEVELWRNIMGLGEKTPFDFHLTQGQLSELAYVAYAKASDFAIAGVIDKALPHDYSSKLSLGFINQSKEGYGGTMKDYRMPVAVSGVNYNWPAALVRENKMEPVDIFENTAWARLDVTKTGSFFLGNTVKATNKNLKIGIQEWTSKSIVLEVNNPTDAAITATVSTIASGPERMPMSLDVTVKPGSSEVLKEVVHP